MADPALGCAGSGSRGAFDVFDPAMTEERSGASG
jgi:hypothetical protein